MKRFFLEIIISQENNFDVHYKVEEPFSVSDMESVIFNLERTKFELMNDLIAKNPGLDFKKAKE